MKRPRRPTKPAGRPRAASRAAAGFTLIELVAVIVLIGALAAFALPRYLSLEDEALTAAAEGTSGALQAGVKLVRSGWAAADRGPTVTEGGVVIPVNGEGWPVPAAATGPACAALWDQVLASAPEVDASAFVIGDPGWFAFPFASGCGYILKTDIDPIRLIVYTPTSGGFVFGQPLVAGNVIFVVL